MDDSAFGNERDHRVAVATLSYQVFTSGSLLFNDGAKGPGGESHRLSSVSSTLIFGKSDAILVDPALTVEQAEELAKWVEKSGKRLKHIFISHGHGDHWFGRQRLLDVSRVRPSWQLREP
jgi:glyoxylase-like metal-dependent hydrolase (beta-lactamase superfamily II)